MSANPLKGSGQFTSHGLSWFAEMVFGVDISTKKNRENFPAVIHAIMESNENFFKDAECVEGLDLSDPANEEEMFKRINANPRTIEWWGYMAAGFGSFALNAIEEGNASEAAWADGHCRKVSRFGYLQGELRRSSFHGPLSSAAHRFCSGPQF